MKIVSDQAQRALQVLFRRPTVEQVGVEGAKQFRVMGQRLMNDFPPRNLAVPQYLDRRQRVHTLQYPEATVVEVPLRMKPFLRFGEARQDLRGGAQHLDGTVVFAEAMARL